MMSEFIEREDLIVVLRRHIADVDWDRFNWDRIIDDGYITSVPHLGVEGCYVYEIGYSDEIPLTIWIDPLTGTEVDYDPFSSREELGL